MKCSKIAKYAIVLFLLGSVNFTMAQSINQDHSFRIYIDNDFLNFRASGTDRYYTNGIRLDYFFSKEKKAKFPSSLLLNISDENNIYGWGLAQFMFTPKHIDVKEIQYDDRPYAGALYAIHSLQSIDKVDNIKITTELYMGVIGPLSLSEQSQTWVHELIDYTIPQGWDTQIPNDILLNYNINIEKQMLNPSKRVLLVGFVETFSGTLYNAAGFGFMLKVGKFNNYFEDYSPITAKKNKFQLYVFMKPNARVVLSNSLLQGGLIYQLSGKNDAYTIEKDQIERLNVMYDVGVNLEFPGFSLLLSQKLRSAEFKGQYVQEVGNITLTFKL
ncbi:MAG: lipid A deacylase LpxR family protein [Bacteroidales bacterium]|nr:lipid A deacylase LpxR family protein [Bacteroidales bacterium]